MENSHAAHVPAPPELTVSRDGMPLLLLAAFHHPDDDLRSRLLRQVDAVIASRQPFASDAEVRHLLGRCRSTREAPFDLDPQSLELTVRVVRLVFARRTKCHAKHRLLIVGPDADEERQGVTLAHAPLRVEPLEPQREWGKGKRKRCRVRLLTGAALARVGTFQLRPSPFTVTCRIDGGFVLDVLGPVGWGFSYRTGSPLAGSALGSGQPLLALGLVGEATAGGLRIRTASPEAMIRFSVCLARREMLCLKLGPRVPAETRVFISMRDFEGDEAVFPAAVFPGDVGEDWLTGLPPVEMQLPLDEALAIARWAYPPEDWLEPEFRDSLLASTG
jgi:hypothetical protein